MKRILAFAAALAAAAVVVPLAAADPPTYPQPPLDLGYTVCHTSKGTFDIHLEGIVNGEKLVKVFSNGRIIITGRFVELVTNLSNGHTITVQASGPVFGSTLTGNSTIFIPADQGGGLFLTRGPVDVTSTSFTPTSAATIDLCERLAAA
jgi:hypothetical protein